jgi:hypothetical protein
MRKEHQNENKQPKAFCPPPPHKIPLTKIILTTVLILSLALASCSEGGGGGNKPDDKYDPSYGGITGGENTPITGGNYTGVPSLNGIWKSSDAASYVGVGCDYVIMKLNNGNGEGGWIINSLFYPTLKATYTTSGTSITLTPTHVHGNNVNLIAGKKVLDAKWYSESELANLGVIASFAPETDTYSVSGSTLTFTTTYGTFTYTKIN